MTVDGLRHTGASRAIKNAVTITMIAWMLWHANGSSNLRAYAHVSAAIEDEATAILDAVYARPVIAAAVWRGRPRIVTNA